MVNTKPKLIVTMDRWLKDGVYIVNDSRLLEEIKVFTRTDDIGKQMGASTGFHDDIIMAAMIAVYTAHQGDFEDNNGIQPTKVEKTPENCDYRMSCDRCLEVWGADDPKEIRRCPYCNSIFVRANRNQHVIAVQKEDPHNEHRDYDPDPEGYLCSWDNKQADRDDFQLY
jgi:uncharacterized CHY-type Zn-finger protein